MQRLHKRLPQLPTALIASLLITLGYHGALLPYTFRRTYDAFVHIFFADHYSRAWFDHWEYRWYTGFTMTSYPPGSHQTVALWSKLIGLEYAFALVQLMAMLIVVVGVYRFSKVWVSPEAAGYASLLAAFASSLTETVHVFGQLPTTFSLGFLLNALPLIHRWLNDGRWPWLLLAWAVNAATTAGHHVTTLFGAVFFVAPIMALAIWQALKQPLADEPADIDLRVSRQTWRPVAALYVRRALPIIVRCAIYGVGLIAILVAVVLPYWLWSASDPISQVPIPHASRDSFLQNRAAGLVFWVIPYGVGLVTLPYAIYKGLTTKAWPMTLSILLLFLLGTGGTTPIPKLLLGGAFDILTLDRFTFWATILLLPLQGEFVRSLRFGRFGRLLREQFGRTTWVASQTVLLVAFVTFSVFVANLTQLRTFQPQPIDMQPIVAFLDKDQHWRWRYLTLGFGDQMAWLATQTHATSVDGNYHSARRLPELTTTPVERLEGAKFRGLPGLGSLQQFLAVPEKYNLKYIFSNDQFYDPLLFFSGWHQVGRLENGIMVWEREDIPPLPEVLPRREIPLWQRAMWGIVPPAALVLGIAALTLVFVRPPRRPATRQLTFPPTLDAWLSRHAQPPVTVVVTARQTRSWRRFQSIKLPAPPANWVRQARTGLLLVTLLVTVAGLSNLIRQRQRSPESVLIAYYDALDFRRFDEAYALLDEAERPTFEQYLIDLSVSGGLVASYAKLDALAVEVLAASAETRTMAVTVDYVTSLNAYRVVETHDMVWRNRRWQLSVPAVDVVVPPDQFFRQGEVNYVAQGRRRVTTETTAFADVQDRPELEILSARMVSVDGRQSVVGELINADADPADITVTAYLLDEAGDTITWYNAQQVAVHKIRPKEITPFRIDFEGVAGAALDAYEPEFRPNAYTPVTGVEATKRVDVYAKAVVTGRDLFRGVGVQSLKVVPEDGVLHLQGELINSGTTEAILPHLLLTYFDEAGDVLWVQDYYLPESIRPQRTLDFRVAIDSAAAIRGERVTVNGFTNLLTNGVLADVPDAAERPTFLLLPPDVGFHALTVTVHAFTGATE